MVVNEHSPRSREIAAYYTERRSIPPENACAIRTEDVEEIDRPVYDAEIEAPLRSCTIAALPAWS